MEIPQSILTFGTIILVCSTIWKFFDILENVASKEAREFTSKWLNNLDITENAIRNWPSIFTHLFDKIYGKKYISIRFVSLSVLTTIILIIVSWIFVINPLNPFIADNIKWINIFREYSEPYQDLPKLFIITICSFILFNILADYSSLIQTRFILGRISKNIHIIERLFLLVIDIIATSLVIVVFYLMYKNILEYWFPLANSKFIYWVGVYNISIFYIFIFTSFFSSSWLWLSTTSSFIIKYSTRISFGLRLVRRFLNIDEKPFLSIGIVSSCLVGFLLMLTLLIFNIS